MVIGMKSLNNERGFTIVELMIASLVFSLILVMLTFGVISFSNRYYKGVNASLTQGSAREAIDAVAQAVQFGTSDVTPTDPAKNYFCAGGNFFIYEQGVMYTGDTATTTGLYMVPMTSAICAPPLPVVSATNGRQLLADRTRLTDISVVSTSPNTYTIDMTIAYGDNDLLCAPVSSAGSCGPGASTLPDTDLAGASDVQCKTISGSQFCAVSQISTAVHKRVVKT